MQKIVLESQVESRVIYYKVPIIVMFVYNSKYILFIQASILQWFKLFLHF